MRYTEEALIKFNNLKNNENVIILAIESSCDETSLALLKNGRVVLGSIVSSQIDIHKRFGGVVPEVASRNHLLAINNIFVTLCAECKIDVSQIDAVAVTYGAGLVGALMVGVNYAKSLAYALKVPLIKVNHIRAHISANYVTNPNLKPPFLALVVSGGHTALIDVLNYTDQNVIGTTHDDAVGEAYDKVAKVLGLEYPGGPKIDVLAKKGNGNISFIKPNSNLGEFDFSYSGIKTAVINYVHKCESNKTQIVIEDVCASFQKTAIDELVKKSINAMKVYKYKTLVVAGGVSANSYLRESIVRAGIENKINVLIPDLKFCTDNAVMVGSEAYNLIKSGVGLADLGLTANPSINLKYS